MTAFGELYAAEAGWRRITAKGPGKLVTQDHRARMQRAPDRIAKLVKRFLSDGTGASPPGPDVDVTGTIEALTAEPDLSSLQLRMSDFADAEESGDAMAHVMHLRAQLTGIMPAMSRQTAVGTMPMTPARAEGSEFVRVVQVADDPWWALELLAVGGLPRDVAEALWRLYPTMAEGAKEEIARQLAERQATSTVRLTRRQTLALASFLGEVDSDPDAIAAMLTAKAESQEGQQQGRPPAPSGAAGSRFAGQAQTELQRIEAGR